MGIVIFDFLCYNAYIINKYNVSKILNRRLL